MDPFPARFRQHLNGSCPVGKGSSMLSKVGFWKPGSWMGKLVGKSRHRAATIDAYAMEDVGEILFTEKTVKRPSISLGGVRVSRHSCA